MIEHLNLEVNGATLHIAQCGNGTSLPLHGCPEFWLTWEPVMARLADRFRLVAPDLRGFGDSDKSVGTFGPAEQGGDRALLPVRFYATLLGCILTAIGTAIAYPELINRGYCLSCVLTGRS